MDKKMLSEINKFTRREFKEEELYVFSVILCDNEVDRDNECFSDNALESLKSLFVGKTGIFDHNATTSNQNARIFSTEVITDSEKLTKYGKPYKYLKAMAYMVRTEENKNLIAEIDAGIKKEVSISCTAAKKICSVCGNDRVKTGCSHIKGKKYAEKECYYILDDIKDAYEWSFVAVPAQINAGVTKKHTAEATEKSAISDIQEVNSELRRDIRRLAFFRGGKSAAETAELSARGMTTQQLISLKKAYERLSTRKPPELQLVPEEKKENTQSYKI